MCGQKVLSLLPCESHFKQSHSFSQFSDFSFVYNLQLERSTYRIASKMGELMGYRMNKHKSITRLCSLIFFLMSKREEN